MVAVSVWYSRTQ